MDFKAAPVIVNALEQRLEHGVFGYEVSRAEIGDAVTNWYRTRHAWSFDSQQLVFSPRTLSSLATLICLFSNEGNGVIVQPPVFYDFKLIIKSNHRKLVKNALSLVDGRYTMNFSGLEKLASDPNNKLLILCNPHNPLGRVWSRDELVQLADICIKHGVYVIADEIHGDISYNRKYTPIASLSTAVMNNTATCISPIKSFNLAGVGNSMIVIADAERRKICADWYSRMEINRNNVFTNAAMLAAYTKGGPWLDSVIEYLQGNIDEVRKTLRDCQHGIHLVEPDGTFLIWLDFRKLGLDARQLAEFLSKDAHMAVNPGHWFGREGAGFARVNIACPRQVLQAALRQLVGSVNKLPQRNQV
jgi:cystathionine beta-lyase